MAGRDLMLLTLAAVILICSAAPLMPAGKQRGLGLTLSRGHSFGSTQNPRRPPGPLQPN